MSAYRAIVPSPVGEPTGNVPILFARNSSLSLTAIGVGSFLLVSPQQWWTAEQLCESNSDDVEDIVEALKELETTGLFEVRA